MKLKKKQIGILFLMLLSLFAYSTWVTYSSSQMLSNEDFIRLHVIANSDSEQDQELKLLVRDGLLNSINSGLVAETMAMANKNQDRVSLDLEKTREYIRENLYEIERTAAAIVTSNDYNYPVNAKYTVTWIPKKTYGEITFPAGNYEALNVTIGEGSGQNWWCVLFPPLCLIDSENPESDAVYEEIYKEILMDKKYRDLLENKEHPRTLQLKFKTLEMLK